MKKILKVLGIGFVLSILVFAIRPSEVQAKVDAKEILSNALEEMKNSESISMVEKYTLNYIDNGNSKHRYYYVDGLVFSDNAIDYSYCFTDSDSSLEAYICYVVGDRCYYRYPNKTNFEAYDYKDYNKDKETVKIGLEYDMSHLKSVKLSKTSKKYYTITAKPNYKDSGYSKITYLISRKTGQVVSVKYDLSKGLTRHYRNSTNTYTISGGSLEYSNISYGDTTIELPDELKGK